MSGTIQRHTRHLIHLQTERETLLVTPEHPFATLGSGWVAASALSPGDFLVSAKSGIVRVTAVHARALARPVPVFNLTIEPTHSYLVGTHGVLVHNTDCNGDERKTNELMRIIDLRIKITSHRSAETKARTTRQQLLAAGKDTSKLDGKIARLTQDRTELVERLALERVRQIQENTLTDMRWMHGMRTELDQARLEELRQKLAQGNLSKNDLTELDRELARSEPINQEYLAAFWRELSVLDRKASSNSPQQELLKQFRELEARDTELHDEYMLSRGARRRELAERRSRLRKTWRAEARLLLERARQQLGSAKATPERSDRRFEAELEETIAFIEGELEKDHRRGPRTLATMRKLAALSDQKRRLRQQIHSARNQLELAGWAGRRDLQTKITKRKLDDAVQALHELRAEVAGIKATLDASELTLADLQDAVLDQADDVDEILNERAQLVRRCPSPERAAEFQSSNERLQHKLGEERAAIELALSALVSESARLQMTQVGSASGPTWQALQNELNHLREQWNERLQTRLSGAQQRRALLRRNQTFYDEAVDELEREIRLLERELASPL